MATRQLIEVRKHIPSLYALLAVNACAVAYTHYTYAPRYLTLIVPCIIVGICAARSIVWWKMQPAKASEAEAAHRLRSTLILTAVIAISAVAWAMALERYGGPYEQGHVAIYVAVTAVACIFCLTHFPTAAFLLTAIINGVFFVHCLSKGNGVFVAIALNTAFVTIVMVRILRGNFQAFVQLLASQDEAQRLAEENAKLAHTDSLTELPNRRFFFQKLNQAIETASRQDIPFALAILDLDHFKPVNDTYGHAAGDRVLTATASRLAMFIDTDVTVARLGGDEFGVLMRSPASAEAVIAFCDHICEVLEAPIRFGQTQFGTGCSGGLALYPQAGRDADALFDRADYALYHSKIHRRGKTTLFSHEHEDAIRAERAVEAAIRGAELSSELEMHYQPILDTNTGEIAFVEGLARWTSPSLGRIPPTRFIAAAERCGMIHVVTLSLLRKALADAARLPQSIGLSFNLSAHDLTSAETVIAILAAVRESGFDPHRLTLELTETALMRDFERAAESIKLLHALGIKIALDDFGTGYSSLGHVHRLPLDKIKIDRSFMADIDTPLGRSVVTTILDLCQNLGFDCIAEGIETVEQLHAVRLHGCRYVQGYLVGVPMPLDALLSKLSASDSDMPALRRA